MVAAYQSTDFSSVLPFSSPLSPSRAARSSSLTNIFVIEVPPKLWRPKPLDRYIPVDYADDVDESVFLFERYGKTIRHTRDPFVQNRDPADIHHWDPLRDKAEFDKDFKIARSISPNTRQAVVDIIEANWDCFYSEGVSKPILNFEFCIDTGASPPVCCRKPRYGPHESRIIMTQIDVLLDNGWIEECGGAWGSSIVLAAKPHQEHVTNIDDFVWRMCVSYRALNTVTLPFEYPIPRCDDAIDDFGDSAGRLFFISLDNKTGYHQILVRLRDREKLAFFAPNGKKYTFTVMPFGPRNAPAYYTCMMCFFQEEFNSLFLERHPALAAAASFHKGSRIIIDDILLWSTDIVVILKYFECVCTVFSKYRVTFQLKKCEFLKDRVEYVGHDITPDGNCPAQSKFDLITDWPLPKTGQSLISFIGLLTFYCVYCPWFEIRVKPLRALERVHHRKPIPADRWTPALISLWNELKLGVTSSPCLARYDAKLPCFLKTDWSAIGMGWILMQPDNSTASVIALTKLLATGECDFDLTKSGARLRPVRFGSRKCTEREQHYHSFVGEAAAGRWSISQNKKFLWGAQFYWLCDCNAMREILEYCGSIHQIRRWAQELLGYHFLIFHRPARMMQDVDGLNRRFADPLIALHLSVAQRLRDTDSLQRPEAYITSTFHLGNPIKCRPLATPDSSTPSCLSAAISSFANLANLPIRFRPCTAFPSTRPSDTACSMFHSSHALLNNLTLGCLSITPLFGAIPAAFQCHRHSTTIASLVCQPPCYDGIFLPFSLENVLSHLLLFTSFSPTIAPDDPDVVILHDFCRRFPRLSGIDLTCPFHGILQSMRWLETAASLIDCMTLHFDMSCFFLIISLPEDSACGVAFSSFVSDHFSPPWFISSGPTTSTLYGDGVHARRWLCSGQRQLGMYPPPSPSFPPIDDAIGRYGDHVLPTLNQTDSSSLPLPASLLRTPHLDYHPRVAPKIIAILTSPADPCEFFVLDPDYPATEPFVGHDPPSSIFSSTFGIPFTSSFGSHFTRPFSLNKMLACYSIPHAVINALPTTSTLSAFAPDLQCCCPFLLGDRLVTHLLSSYQFSDFDAAACPSSFVTRSLLSQVDSHRPIPTAANWSSAYDQDSDTKFILSHLSTKTSFSRSDLSSLPTAYREYIREQRITIHDGKLVVFQQVQNNTELLMLIVVPSGLRRDIFSAYHASPSAGHMGVYKTLHRIRLRFFWPLCRKDITDWVLRRPHCIAINGSVAKNSELIFSWPLCCPFYILHVDLWAPGDFANYRGDTYLIDSMCDLTGFVVISAINDISAANLARVFVQEVLLKIGFCGLIVVDDGSNFKGLFEEVCTLLGISCHVAAKGNHKAVGVKHFHRYLNKAVGIAVNDRGSLDVSVEAAHTAAYAWNSSPIDGTDIIRSVPAVGRPFRFPFDLSLGPTPSPTMDQARDCHAFLRLSSPTTQFAEQVLRLLTEERRSIHRERANESRNPHTFAVGDLVMACVQVNSNALAGVVAKLSYRHRGPYEIIESTGTGSYLVQRHGDPTAPILKYPTQSLSALPPALLPCSPIDSTDFRYLNHSHAPLPHPLHHPFKIQMYNNMWFDDTSAASLPPAFKFVDVAIPNPPDPQLPLSVASIPAAAAIPLQPPLDDPLLLPGPTDATSLLAAITTSVDSLFFISYTPTGTLRPRWYLIQVDTTQSTLDPLSRDHAFTGIYYCHFLAKHPDDLSLPDPASRFWPLWHIFSTAADGVLEYGKRVLFPPPIIPNSHRYIAWADCLPLLDPKCCLFGPFNFTDPSATPSSRTPSLRQVVPSTLWHSLTGLCLSHGILPPILSAPTPTRSRWTRSSLR